MMGKKLKILFVTRSATYFHYFRSIIEEFCRRGYKIKFVADKRWTYKFSANFSTKLLDEFSRAYPNFEYEWAIPRIDKWRDWLFYTREILNFRHHFLKTESKHYVDLWRKFLPDTLQSLLRFRFAQFVIGSGVFGWFLFLFEKIAPPYKRISEYIKNFEPDVVISSPVTMRFSSSDLEYLKAAKKLNIPTVTPVYSWDNLSTKGLFHVLPDLLLAWNEEQTKDALCLHGFKKENVKIIGAPVFDSWFPGRDLIISREKFLKDHEIAGPFVLYLGSSGDVGDESAVLEGLRKAMDNSDDRRIREFEIVVRPHPANYKIYEKFSGARGIKIIPKIGSLPDSRAAFSLSYNSIYHSLAVVGLTTSAMVETAIVGKHIIAILRHEYLELQEHNRHFQLFAKDGILELARTYEDCLSIIKKLLDGEDVGSASRGAFIKRLIRPLGVEKSAGEAAADEIEKLLAPGAL